MLSLSDINYYFVAIFGAILTGVGYLIRKVFTDEKKIALLEQKLTSLEGDISDIRSDVKQLLFRNLGDK